jgi:hypothetical protein
MTEGHTFDIHYHEGFTIYFVAELGGITINADKFVAEVGRSYCMRWANKSLMRTSLTYQIIGPREYIHDRTSIHERPDTVDEWRQVGPAAIGLRTDQPAPWM